MRTNSLAVFAWAVLVGGWVAACGDDDHVVRGGVDGSADAAPPTIVACNTIEYRGCTFEDVGCAANVLAFDVDLEQTANACGLHAHIECDADGCVESVDILADVPPGGDGGITPGGNLALLGAACASDMDCGTGMTCLAPDGASWYAGGPSNGYCTISCVEDATVCAQRPGAVCVGGGSADEAFCFEGCVLGGDPNGKCGNRVDVACLLVGQTAALQPISACLPTCGSDNQCPAGRFCDLLSGVCVDDAPVGDPIGTLCDPMAAVDPCAGFCMDFGGGIAMCSGLCTVGLDAPGCGINPATEDITPGAPVCLPLFSATDTVGDTGLCIQRCDCNDHCLHPNTACEGFNDTVLSDAFSSEGICFFQPAEGGVAGLSCELADGGPVPMSDAGPGPGSDASTPALDASVVPPDAATVLDAGDGG